MKWIFALLVVAVASVSSTLTDRPAQAQELTSLPRMRAIPLGARGVEQAPDALQNPVYCDSEALRDSATLRAIHFGSGPFGLAVGDHGVILRSDDSGQSWKTCSCLVRCALADVIVLNDRYAVAVGGGYECVTSISRGAVLISSDAGLTWERGEDRELPRLKSIRADRVNGKTVLISSGDADPITGATEFRSRDGGRTWESILATATETNIDVAGTIDARRAAIVAQAAGSAATFRASSKLDDGTWLIAGDHGQILRSTDRGETWISARGVASQSAVLFITANTDHIPWSLIGREALEQRRRVSVLVGTGNGVTTATAQQAAMRLGAASLDGFASEGDLASQLRHWIDVHQPPVLALDALLPRELRSELLTHAVGLGTQKVVEFSHGRRGDSVLHRGALLPSSGALAGDFEIDAWLLVSKDIQSALDGETQQISVKTRYSAGDSESLNDALTSGVRLSQAHFLPPRREKASRRLLQITQARLQQQAAVDQLIEQARDSDLVRDSIEQMLRHTDRPDRFRSTSLILARSQGSVAETAAWQFFAERFPHTSAGALAALRNRAHASSRERARLERRFAQATVTTSSDHNEVLTDSVTQASHAAIVSPFQSPEDNPVVQASASLPAQTSPFSATTPTRPSPAAIEVDLAWQMHPLRLIVEDSLRQKSEMPIEAETEPASTQDRDVQSADLRRVAARSGGWSELLKPDSPQVARATLAETPPVLDGKLDEPFWSNAATARTENKTTVHVAFDQRFLYVAVETNAELLAQLNDTTNQQGQRDADLTDVDRLLLRLDIDRDLFTAFELQFTRDGRTHDSIDHHGQWDPTWYLASSQTRDLVTTELAIERESLGIDIEPNDRWFMEVQAIRAGEQASRPWMPRPESRIRVDF
ncbi:MAG: hypothetical protein AAFX06_07190 [Planctomycetota bacterium]